MTSKYIPKTVEPNKSFYKHNYVKATEIITPKFYIEDDITLSGNGLSIIDELINTHINIADKFSTVIISSIGGISPVTGTAYSSINTIDGLAPFFVRQNNLTDIDANDFERKILLKTNRSFNDFTTSSQFRNYLITDLLPSIVLNNPTVTLQGVSASERHEYLITNLSWLYFLNVSGATYDGSTIVADAIVDTIWSGKKFLINDAIKCLTEYVFRNFIANLNKWISGGFIPTDYLPNLVLADTTYTSGTQQLDKLKTLIDIVYSPDFSDRSDEKVKNAFDQFIENGLYLDDVEPQGPFHKYLKAISYAFADYSNKVDDLGLLNNLLKCPDEYLPYLADLLGWTLVGSEPLKWRLQLLNSITIYKSVGTKKALQYIIDSTFSKDSLDLSSKVLEMWESYVPHLIYYALATESKPLQNFETWTPDEATRLGVTHIASSIDESVRCVVDEILLRTANKFSLDFWYMGQRVNISDPRLNFNYRGRDIKVPPFEEYQYYIYQKLNGNILDYIVDELICFGVPESFAQQVGDFIANNSLRSTDDISLGYSWLLFTSGNEYPPNWDSLILDISNKKTEYLPLWNGKSSHFKMLFETNSFTFADDSLAVTTREGLRVLSQLVDEFSPAHAIKQLYIMASASDSYTSDAIELPYIKIDHEDPFDQNGSDTLAFSNYEVSGHNLNFYKRGRTDTYNIVSRESTDSIVDTLLQTGAIAVPRKSFRRRSFKNILNTHGFYNRDGFNMPTTFENYVKETSYSSLGFLPLGLIPSSQQFVPIPDYDNIPDIYSICEGLNSSSIFSGLTVSNTFPCRGLPRQSNVIPVPDDPIDVYLWLGDSLATGDVVYNSLSSMNTYYTQIKENVSGTYIFTPSSASFELLKPGKNSDVLRTSTGGLSAVIGGDWTFGYETYIKNNRNSYIIKLGLPNSYYTSAAGSNYTASISPEFNYSTSINDWAVESTGEILSIYKNWITSAISNLQSIYGDRVTYRGAISFFGTNVNTGLLTSEELIEYTTLGTAPKFVNRVVSSINNIKQNIEDHIKSKGIYKGSPIWVMSYPDVRYVAAIPVFGTAYYDLLRNYLGSLSSLNNNLYFYDPPSYLTLVDEPPTVFDVHYDGSSNLFLGSSIANFFSESRLDASRLGYDAYDYSNDRSQLDNIMSVIFYIGENSKNVLASAIVSQDLSSYVNYLPWKNVVQSIANQLTEQDTGFPTSYSDYTNIKFGKEVHKLYNHYCREFGRYKLLKQYLNLDGPTIFAHTFGSIFRNSDFTLFGSSVNLTPQIITSSIDNELRLRSGSVWFPVSGGGAHNAFLLQPSSFRIAASDIGNSSIFEGVDLIHSVGGGQQNYFSIFDLGKESLKDYSFKKDSYVTYNNLIKLSNKARNTLPRIRFDLKSYSHSSTKGYPLTTNFLIPEHEFELNIAALLTDDTFTNFGGGSVGVFIHTGYEASGTWVFNRSGKWEFVSIGDIDLTSVRDVYAHKLTFQNELLDLSSEPCIVNNNLLNLYSLMETNFKNFKLNFNTINKRIRVPEAYYKTYQQVHRLDQNYYVEIFLYTNPDKTLYLDYVNLIDSTLNKWSQVLVSATGNPFPVGDFNCKEFRLPLTKEHLYHIFKYFTQITGSQTKFGKASRIASITEGLFETSGGGRLNYIQNPKWSTNVEYPVGSLVSSLYINN